MKNFLIFSALSLFASTTAISQENSSFYATMALGDAKELMKEFPEGIRIIDKKRNEAAVLLTEEASHIIHERVLTHGPGYIYKATRNDALQSLGSKEKKSTLGLDEFTITERKIVDKVLDVISAKNIGNHIQELENYGTRYHTYTSAKNSAKDLKKKWEKMAALYNRNDVSVRLVQHINTPMPSVVMTITGSELPDQYVIVGGHLDSTSRNGKANAPGADDDASGIATITEATRALFEIGFEPKRTIEVMAYAAEEIGLVGSAEIARSYKRAKKNVVAVTQFDMTNYNGSAKDVYFIEDNTDATLNSFLKQLIDTYNNPSGKHRLSYGTSRCNYGCSDHDSWNNQGYKASFPFEASFSSSNPNIHTAGDKFSLSGTADHAAKFAKLCAEFLIEVAKSKTNALATNDYNKEDYKVFVQNGILNYSIPKTTNQVKLIEVFDVNGRKVFQQSNPINEGTLSLKGKSSGVYVVSFLLDNNNTISYKVVLE